jgi:hypothetical protein
MDSVTGSTAWKVGSGAFIAGLSVGFLSGLIRTVITNQITGLHYLFFAPSGRARAEDKPGCAGLRIVSAGQNPALIDAGFMYDWLPVKSNP